MHKSAVTEHIARKNCVIDWEGAKVIDREDNKHTRWIKEAIWIRKSAPVMNRDEGGLDSATFGTAFLPLRQKAARISNESHSKTYSCRVIRHNRSISLVYNTEVTYHVRERILSS